MVEGALEIYLQQQLGQTISQKDFAQALETAHSFKVPLAHILLDKGLVNEDILGKTVAAYLGVPFVSLKGKTISPDVLALIPEQTARQQHVVVFEKQGNVLSVAMLDPKNVETIEFLKKKTDGTITPFYTLESHLREALNQYKVSLRKEFESIIKENIEQTGHLERDLERAAKELPVIKALDTLLEYAIAEKASDIHIEGIEENVIIRFRIDGVLHDMITLSKELHPALVARVKILSNLKIDEHRLPQDGRFKFSMGDADIAFRVSVIPAFYGENIVMRLLPESERPKTLPELGFSGRNLQVIMNNLGKPHGLVLVTGPTGSGKTTTLYSLLNIVNSPEIKICTVEDPIEYGMRRISQIQVNTKTGLTFAEGLRALLRHDPDVIMVGEIRDTETANIAIHSALTGHLVLSTLHTNDAISAIPRFIDLGVESFLVATTVNVIIAQRLVRTICASCKQTITPKPELLAEIAQNVGIDVNELSAHPFYAVAGCSECHHTGYSGRMGIYEVFEIDDDARALITKQVSTAQLAEHAQQKGMSTMMHDGFAKAIAGQTTLDEVYRVARE